ncbi:M23 family metallopeptidase [Nocardioides sp. BP30]|uniref:M23 family metallopeptidase n=1 Tax=Nocardioides sp. BP30 TaxID=3036374 RepID=UPI0024687BB3|nr:M23 family metallopeptidase [Nocardioides sp. BP30]WGL51743.1 M23 family metallopeptidase [Nocardioides sp. BP30]
MGNHRADVVVDSHPSEETPETSSYVGRRRAATIVEVPAQAEAQTPPAAPYVGKRRAAVPVEEPPAEVQHAVLTALSVAAAAPAQAPAPALEAAAPLGVPAPRRTFTQDAPAVIEPVETELVKPLEHLATSVLQTATESTVETTAWRDLRIDTGSLPPFEETAAYATDFGAETTSHLPIVSIGKRRAGGGTGARTGNPLFKRLPSAPLALGVASLAIAVGGAVTAAHAPAHTTHDSFVAASALAGASDVGRVGAPAGRSATVSRSSDRSTSAAADQAVEERNKALTKINDKATTQDQFKAANQWGLPITAGGYHLTGRFDDVSGLWASVHTGLDFACPTGTEIHAVAGGTITEVGWAGAYGNRTVETLPDGTELWYAHQVRFGATVGEKVTEGEVIGYVGSTGNTTGPHVHLEVRPGGGDPVDPDTALKAHGIDPDANQ